MNQLKNIKLNNSYFAFSVECVDAITGSDLGPVCSSSCIRQFGQVKVKKEFQRETKRKRKKKNIKRKISINTQIELKCAHNQ